MAFNESEITSPRPPAELQDAWYKAASERQKRVDLEDTIAQLVQVVRNAEFQDVHSLREAILYLLESEGLCNTPMNDGKEQNQ